MLVSLIFLPVFLGLSAALTVIVADLLSPETKKAKGTAKKLGGNRAASA